MRVGKTPGSQNSSKAINIAADLRTLRTHLPPASPRIFRYDRNLLQSRCLAVCPQRVASRRSSFFGRLLQQLPELVALLVNRGDHRAGRNAKPMRAEQRPGPELAEHRAEAPSMHHRHDDTGGAEHHQCVAVNRNIERCRHAVLRSLDDLLTTVRGFDGAGESRLAQRRYLICPDLGESRRL